jgi:hypothetical protein
VWRALLLLLLLVVVAVVVLLLLVVLVLLLLLRLVLRLRVQLWELAPMTQLTARQPTQADANNKHCQ